MVTVIVRELHQREMLFPAVAEINNTCPKHVFKGLDSSLRLPIRLRMICCAHV
ncbi:hypothetical protein HanXRQr2_Chr13g0608881 [Helianthus annuus]|uniref:Uncharacterized protein n=1 Tax=Helianthus annuus TaxID=4232 RepID=A0A9K3EK04_HELAN|nr:hypothetical protein HanXRQr2_Chr13g0608881 [Helianthus annuus]KAJ0951638.1 hypothetical protein HanPSC8_Chr02g0062571 [Helianthus annuus]